MRELLRERNYHKWGYVVRTERLSGEDAAGGPPFEMRSAFTLEGGYLGNPKDARFLCAKRGIRPEKAHPSHNVCSIGFCQKEQKWYGWSHRAIFGFGIGDVVKEGDCCAESGWTEEYLVEHPEEDRRLPVGFEAKTLDDAKRMAVAFAESVS
ncbi:hypothetical protein LCGC14_3007390 [marine sediment metagenome]|uniref:Uncharacterized protein n=1 Tax=marine sediment metagenome TaxID=412755 RepID=A0A0F8WZ33_9ZZZZ